MESLGEQKQDRILHQVKGGISQSGLFHTDLKKLCTPKGDYGLGERVSHGWGGLGRVATQRFFFFFLGG
jgi:hypothetical protein